MFPLHRDLGRLISYQVLIVAHVARCESIVADQCDHWEIICENQTGNSACLFATVTSKQWRSGFVSLVLQGSKTVEAIM